MANCTFNFSRYRPTVLRFWLIACVFMWFSFATSAMAGNKPSVLLISSYHPGFPTFFQQVEGIKSVFGKEVHLDIEFMDSKRYPHEENRQNFQKALAYKLGKENPYDVFMVGDDNAFIFTQAPINTHLIMTNWKGTASADLFCRRGALF